MINFVIYLCYEGDSELLKYFCRTFIIVKRYMRDPLA